MGSIAQSEASQVYSDYEQHSSGLMRSTDVVISSSLHKHHPDLTLAVTSTSTCDLLGFADAGFATAGLDSSSGTFSALRSYKPPATQLYGAEGTLENEIHFAKYDYRWFEYDFLVYMVVGYREPMCASRNTYILHRPQGNETVHSQSAVTDELITAVSQWTVELHNEVAVFDMGTWGKSRELWKSVQDASWDDVILDDETKKSLINDVEGFFNARDSYKKYAVPWKRGIIMYGPPGNGKTISMRALMNSLSKRTEPIASLYVKSLVARGGPEYAIRSIFLKARASAPCLLILEDIDSLVTDKVRSYFLNEVDGLERNDGILILGSTNHLDKLDPGIVKRPSRFDRKYAFQVPVLAERVQYCEYWRQKLKPNPDIHFPPDLCPLMADLTGEFTFAYMKEAFIATLLRLASRPAAADPASTITKAENSAGSKGEDNAMGLSSSPFFEEFKTQVKILREQMSEKPSVEGITTETKVVVQTGGGGTVG